MLKDIFFNRKRLTTFTAVFVAFGVVVGIIWEVGIINAIPIENKCIIGKDMPYKNTGNKRCRKRKMAKKIRKIKHLFITIYFNYAHKKNPGIPGFFMSELFTFLPKMFLLFWRFVDRTTYSFK